MDRTVTPDEHSGIHEISLETATRLAGNVDSEVIELNGKYYEVSDAGIQDLVDFIKRSMRSNTNV